MKPIIDNIWHRLYLMRPKEYHWPYSALYSRIASVMEPAYEHIARMTALPRHLETLLEVGGGDGRFAVALARQYPNLSRIITTDISKDMTDRARKRAMKNGLGNRIYSEVQDVHNLNYQDNCFDVVVSIFSMHHWREPTKGLLELDRVLKPEGILIVIDGHDRPSFKSTRRTASAFGGSIWTSIAYWIGSKDVLSYSEIAHIVEKCEIKYISILVDEQVLAVGGVKES